MVKLKIKAIHVDAVIPKQANEGDAGFDLTSIHDLVINPGQRLLVQTGLTMEIPKGYEGQVRPRSGLALKNGITVLNSPGTIDAGYRGEVGVILYNTGEHPFQIEKGMRIAQMVIQSVPKVMIEEVRELSDSERGEGGFGSTGVK